MGTKPPDTGLRRLPVFAGLAIVIVPRLVWYVYPPRAGLSPAGRTLANIAFAWAVTAALLVLVRFWERRPLSSIGIRRLSARDAWWGIAAFLLGGAIIMGTMPLVSALGLASTESGVRRLGELSVWLRVLIVLTAGITEEIRYRGYLLERLTELTGRLGLSAVISYVFFVLLHIPFWGPGGTIQIGLGSVVLYVLYVKRRNLPACMLMHLLNDGVAFLLVPLALPAAP